MNNKNHKLDAATIRVMEKMLATPPKPHNEMKVGRPAKKKKRDPKDRASSSKRRSA